MREGAFATGTRRDMSGKFETLCVELGDRAYNILIGPALIALMPFKS